MANITHNNDKCIIFTDTEEVKETLGTMPGFHQLRLELAKKDKPQGYDPGEDVFGDSWKTKFCKRWRISVQKKKQIIKQSQSTNGFIKFQTITIMPSIEQGLSLCNQIYLSKQVFVNTTKIF